MNKLDKTKAEMQFCTFSDIRHLFKEFHYKGDAMGGGISICFAMLIDNKLAGGSVLGKPRHESKYKNCVDVRRMACTDEAPSNSESWFLGQIINWVTRNTAYNFVLSYSDKSVGHNGTIYKASNFKQIGETSPTQFVRYNGKTYHPRSLSIERPYSYELREAVKKGEAIIETGLPKIIWLYTIRRKARMQPVNLLKFKKGGSQVMLML